MQLNWHTLLLILVMIFAQQPLSAQKNSPKKRIAVLGFEDKSDSDFGWWGQKSVGEGVSDMIVTELVNADQYRVIERDQLNKILQEQDLGTSGIVTPESAAQVGKVLGVEIAVFGAVTEYGYVRDDSRIRIGSTGLGVGKQTAVAGIDLRIVNTTTGEIMVAENVRNSKRAMSGSINVKDFSFDNQRSFDESLVGKVTRKSVEDVVQKINKQAEIVPWQAKIITVQDGLVYINSGALDNLQIGESFYVYREGQALVDPETGLELGSIDEKIGSVEVVDNNVADGKAAACKIVSGGNFERGDVIKEN